MLRMSSENKRHAWVQIIFKITNDTETYYLHSSHFEMVPIPRKWKYLAIYLTYHVNAQCKLKY